MKHSQKIRILFDADRLVIGNRSGVGNYTAQLIESLAKEDNIELVGHYFNFLGKNKYELPTNPNIHYRQSKLLPRKLVNVLRRARISPPFELLIKTRGDVILYPNFIGYPSLFKTPFIPVIHDLSYIEEAEHVSPRNRRDLEALVPPTLRRAALILTVSRATETAIRAHYPAVTTPILVEHIPAPTPFVSAQPARLEDMHINQPYILFLGTIEPRKNITSLLAAYTLLPSTLTSRYSLVLAGGKGWQDETIRRAINDASASGLSVIETGYVDNEQKHQLYTHASVFVLPSFYEGFGMPLIEAQHYGVPVLASDISVFHEVAGEGAVFCDPHDPKDIAKQLERILTDENLRKRLADASADQPHTTWQSVAHSVVTAVRDMLNKSKSGA